MANNLHTYIMQFVKSFEEKIATDGPLENPNEKSLKVRTLDERYLEQMSKGGNIAINVHLSCFNNVTYFHKHDFFELIYVYRGILKNVLDGKVMYLNQGDYCLINPNAVHAVSTIGVRPVVFNILIKKSLLEKTFITQILDNDLISVFFLNSLFNKKYPVNYLLFNSEYMDSYITEQFLTSYLREYFKSEENANKMIELSIFSLFIGLSRCYKKQFISETPISTSDHNVTMMLNYMSHNFKTVTVESLAKEFNYHPKYIPNMLKNHTGKTFSEIIRDSKLNYACVLMKQTDMTITSIIQESGYSNRTQFYHVFEEHFGMSPNEFRKFNSHSKYELSELNIV